MGNAEDVVRQPIIIRRKLVQVVVFQQLLWDDLTVGERNLEQDGVRVLEEWVIKKIFQEELKTDLEAELPLNQFRERLNDEIKFNNR
jgi:hypothetical protein